MKTVMCSLRHDVEVIKIIKNFSEAPHEEDFPEPVMLRHSHALQLIVFAVFVCTYFSRMQEILN